ncbi:MAG: hypothetical protein HY830_21090 [Actinobacteria bacterium]|nr:hypothetical protein [Actinomycetota bacterium]
MTARTTGGQPRPGRPTGPTKRPAKRPAAAAKGSRSTADTPQVDGTAALKPVPVDPADAPASTFVPVAVPPIDASVLLRAIMTPPVGIDGGELTDALTGAVPTWRLDEEPIYLEVVRDLGVPALAEDTGGTGEVIVGEVVG